MLRRACASSCIIERCQRARVDQCRGTAVFGTRSGRASRTTVAVCCLHLLIHKSSLSPPTLSQPHNLAPTGYEPKGRLYTNRIVASVSPPFYRLLLSTPTVTSLRARSSAVLLLLRARTLRRVSFVAAYARTLPLLSTSLWPPPLTSPACPSLYSPRTITTSGRRRYALG